MRRAHSLAIPPEMQAEMQDRAMAMARCDLPAPVPPISTELHCGKMKPPVARLRGIARTIARAAAPPPPLQQHGVRLSTPRAAGKVS